MTLEEASALIDDIGVAAPKSLDGPSIAAALTIFADHLRKTRTDLSMAGVDGAPSWAAYETELWQLSERLRPVLLTRKDWRADSAVLKALASICKNRSYSKGRQNMVLMLGQFGGIGEATALSAMIDDPDVQGHVFKALSKLRDARYQESVAQLIPQLSGWKRAAAKKYLALQPAK
jgi:hypothetical protein